MMFQEVEPYENFDLKCFWNRLFKAGDQARATYGDFQE
jgi:hypothetical protein